MESMTNAPHLLPGARAGYRIGDGVLIDSMMYDGLYCAFDECAMGEGTEKYAQAHGLIREHMDAMAADPTAAPMPRSAANCSPTRSCR